VPVGDLDAGLVADRFDDAGDFLAGDERQGDPQGERVSP
jgi:hypothetical protein